MKTVNIDEVTIGSILEEPIYLNGIMLCLKGTPISINLRGILKECGIEELKVNAIFNEKIDKARLNAVTLDTFTCLAIQRLNIDDIIVCAKTLVHSVLTDKYYDVLSTFFNGDPTTQHHSISVAELAVTVGFKIGLTPNELRILAVGSLLHDIGKTGVKLDIINKEGKLTKEEIEVVRMHPKVGHDTLKDSPILSGYEQQIILQHHERWDGKGYPNKLYGKNTYRLARLVHICDVYEAMCSKRPYKEPIPRRIVREELVKGAGTSFDPRLLKIFLEVVPMYTIGEEITCNGKLGIICNNSNPEDPTVFSSNGLLKLSEFELVSEERKALLRDVLSTLR